MKAWSSLSLTFGKKMMYFVIVLLEVHIGAATKNYFVIG